jgi:hypothetical protein
MYSDIILTWRLDLVVSTPRCQGDTSSCPPPYRPQAPFLVPSLYWSWLTECLLSTASLFVLFSDYLVGSTYTDGAKSGHAWNENTYEYIFSLRFCIQFNFITFHVCPYKHPYRHINKYSSSSNVQNGRLPRWHNFAAWDGQFDVGGRCPCARSERRFISWGGKKELTLLKCSQISPARPSDKGEWNWRRESGKCSNLRQR